jgi:hypothetical protein
VSRDGGGDGDVMTGGGGDDGTRVVGGVAVPGDGDACDAL